MADDPRSFFYNKLRHWGITAIIAKAFNVLANFLILSDPLLFKVAEHSFAGGQR